MENLLSPVILFFILGGLAAFARSDLTIPETLSKTLSLYLMCAIGLKGGVLISNNGFTIDLLFAGTAGLLLSFLLPILAFAILRSFGKLDTTNAAAVSAHYGSVSVVTFITANQVLSDKGMAPAGYMIAVLALMETPAIISGLFLAKRGLTLSFQPNSDLMRETLLNGSIVLLTGSFIIGIIIGKDGFAPIAPVFETGFTGLLCLFLLDMGLLAVRRLRNARSLTFRLVILGIAFPIMNGLIGTIIGAAVGLDAGTTTALAILAASASYIAVPAAMRLALPKADAGLYLAMSLAITFPFNVIIGIPLFNQIAIYMVQLWS
ncbi:MAG: sodium-dependent bicarbonate transport family permease [Rhizobiaceae bacterium]|nr:sodium-dependent bicarbonate transport family permease [Rhizobiaceae bacterium]